MPSRRVFSVVRDDRGRPVGDGPVTPTSDLRAEHAEPSSPPAPDRAFGDDNTFVSVAVRDRGHLDDKPTVGGDGLEGGVVKISSAIASPGRVGDGGPVAQQVLDDVALVPTAVWGRDELHAGEMLNSNSVTSGSSHRSESDAGLIEPPKNGRAPGWGAGLAVARRIVGTARPAGNGPVTRGSSTAVPSPRIGVRSAWLRGACRNFSWINRRRRRSRPRPRPG